MVGSATSSAKLARPLFELAGLTVDLIAGAQRQAGLLQDVSFDIASGETVALIGESGCGKTMTAMAVLGLLPDAVRIAEGAAFLDGVDLMGRGRQTIPFRGSSVGAIFQDPMSSLNPSMPVGEQIAESRRIHLRDSKRAASARAVELLELVGISNARQRSKAYPHEFSGGMQQRVMIAAAIACDPRLLIADEPTTALDVTVQAEILELLADLQAQSGMGILLVTHDLGVVAEVADRVVVMYAGHVVERARTGDLLSDPAHPYTSALLASMPQAGVPRTALQVINGRVPPAGDFPAGCRFHPRCPHARDPDCTTSMIEFRTAGAAHCARCVLVTDPGHEEMAK